MIRPANDGDINLILATWIRSAREASLNSKTSTTFCAELHDRIEATLSDPNTTALVYCDDGDADIAYGYVVGARVPPRIDYIFVKARLRRMGVARALFAELIGSETTRFTATSITPIARAVLAHCKSLRPILPRINSKKKDVEHV